MHALKNYFEELLSCGLYQLRTHGIARLNQIRWETCRDPQMEVLVEYMKQDENSCIIEAEIKIYKEIQISTIG